MTPVAVQEAAQPVYLLAWIPETLLNEKGQSEWDKFVKIEEHAVTNDEDEGMQCHAPCSSRVLTSGLQTPFSSTFLSNAPNHMLSQYH